MSTLPHEPKPTPGAVAAPSPTATPSLARRRLLRAGLGAGPVLMAAAPRSVMAGSCVTASAQTSYSPLKATSHQPTTQQCSGKSPDYWRDNTWPTTCKYVKVGTDIVPATKVKDVFSPPTSTYGEMTLQYVLTSLTATSGEACMVRHMVAAILNAVTFPTMPQQVAGAGVIKKIWYEYWSKSNNRFYEPTAGVKWYCDDSRPRNSGGITPWLKSTMSG